jgi:hypothetical protein
MIIDSMSTANFGPRLEPQEFEKGRPNSDCQDVGHLAYHIITRISKIPEIAHRIPKEKMLKLGSSGYAIDINAGSAPFVDFLETCMTSGDLKCLVRVSIKVNINNEVMLKLINSMTS